jgi:hypothetical protein
MATPAAGDRMTARSVELPSECPRDTPGEGRLMAEPVLSNLELAPHASGYVEQGRHKVDRRRQARYKLAKALSISDHQIRRQ